MHRHRIRVIRFVRFLAILLTLPSGAVAQQQSVAYAGPRAPTPLLPVSPPAWLDVAAATLPDLGPQDSIRVRQRGYTWEGAAIGAAIVGTLGAMALGATCRASDTNDSCIGQYAGGAALGILIGGVIGGMIGGNIAPPSGDAPANKRMDLSSAVYRGRSVVAWR